MEINSNQVLPSDLFGCFIRDPFRGYISDLHLGDQSRSRMEEAGTCFPGVLFLVGSGDLS